MNACKVVCLIKGHDYPLPSSRCRRCQGEMQLSGFALTQLRDAAATARTLPGPFPEFDFEKHTFDPAELAAYRRLYDATKEYVDAIAVPLGPDPDAQRVVRIKTAQERLLWALAEVDAARTARKRPTAGE